jgi:glutaryl-CoA dehydrogenase
VTDVDARRRLDPSDFLDLDDELTADERLLRDGVRRFVREQVLPGIPDAFEAGVFPLGLARQLGELGLLGMHLTGYGCAGVNAVSYGLACMELEAGDSGVRSFASVQGSLCMFPIWRFGSEAQKQTWLPPMARGEAIGCFGLTESGSGSDPGSMRTSARRDGDDFILDGSKMWITNGELAQVAVVWARTEDGVRGFLVPQGTRGFSARPVPRKMSLRASVTSELTFDDVRLPKDAILPGVVGMKGPLSCLNEARFGILFGAVGAARACYEAALAYAGEREQFGKKLAELQLTQQRLVEMLTRISKGQLLALHLGRLKERGKLAPAQVSLGKMDNVREALWVAREARALLGANGITLDYPVMRHLMNLESVYTYEGTNEIHQLIIGQAITGKSAFR